MAPPVPSQQKPDPLIKLRSYQSPPFWRDDIGLMFLLWARQRGKSTLMANKAMKSMMEIAGLLVTYASASLSLGREFIVKEAQLWSRVLDGYRRAAEANQQKLETSADGLNFDDLCDLMEHQRLTTKLYHSRSVYSRSNIIAPNVATARSWSGHVYLDETGFIRDFKELFEAVEPIMSSDPRFRCIMATTPPNDDSNYSYELAVPPLGVEFTPEKANPAGHWYESEAGILVHRADAWDTALAGVPMYDMKTRTPISPDEHRRRALDREAWDRNYGLRFKTGGAAAVSLQALANAMAMGRGKCLAAEDDFPVNWRDKLGNGTFSVGADPATTEGEKSNPFAITIIEHVGMASIARLIIRFKTRDPAKAKAYLREACDLGLGRRPRRLVVDATSERFWAAEVRTEFSHICPVELLVSSEKTTYQGEDVLYKAYLGNLLVNTMDDGLLLLPECRWVKDDFRLVMRDRGSFDNATDSSGNHGDTFDSTKNALHGVLSRLGPIQADGVKVGTYGRSGADHEKNRMRPDHSSDNRTKIRGVSMV